MTRDRSTRSPRHQDGRAPHPARRREHRDRRGFRPRRGKCRNVYQPDDVRCIGSGFRDDRASVGVTGEDRGALLQCNDVTSHGNVVGQRGQVELDLQLGVLINPLHCFLQSKIVGCIFRRESLIEFSLMG
jgi:hypothetical protein